MSMFNTQLFHGTAGQDILCQSMNTGLFSQLKAYDVADIVTVGHDHSNDYWGEYNGMRLMYGRKTGYGSDGPDGMQKGARVFEVTMEGEKYTVDTWIR